MTRGSGLRPAGGRYGAIMEFTQSNAAVPATVWLIERWKVHNPKGAEHGGK